MIISNEQVRKPLFHQKRKCIDKKVKNVNVGIDKRYATGPRNPFLLVVCIAHKSFCASQVLPNAKTPVSFQMIFPSPS